MRTYNEIKKQVEDEINRDYRNAIIAVGVLIVSFALFAIIPLL